MLTNEQRRSRAGIFTMEALVGLTLLLLVFLAMLQIAFSLMQQIEAQDRADDAGRRAAATKPPAGRTALVATTGDKSVTAITWGNEHIWVKVQNRDGSSAARMLPKGAP
jgi:Flp pilus assembly protein TadG